MSRAMCLDGPCGTGKSTLLNKVKNRVVARGLSVDLVEPSRSMSDKDYITIRGYHDLDPVVRYLFDSLKIVYDIPMKIEESEADYIFVERGMPTFIIYESAFLGIDEDSFMKEYFINLGLSKFDTKIDRYIIVRSDQDKLIERIKSRNQNLGIYDKRYLNDKGFRERIDAGFDKIASILPLLDPDADIDIMNNDGEFDDFYNEFIKRNDIGKELTDKI